MTKTRETADVAARRVLKQAELVALEVTKAEAIVEHALAAAAMVMASSGVNGTVALTESAREILGVARIAAAKVLHVAKKEADETLRLAKNLASVRLAEDEMKLAATAPMF